MENCNNEDIKILIEIAYMYYEQGATQSQIGKKYHISRSLVSRYLAKARDYGIVEITVHDELLHPFYKLERELEDVFGLVDVVCTDSYSNKQTQMRRLADSANKYLLRILKQEDVVAVTGGTTVNLMSQIISTTNNYHNVTFVSMTGGLGGNSKEIQANLICENFAQKLSSKSVSLYAPAIVNSQEARSIIKEQKYIKDVLDKAGNADILITGVGGYPSHSTLACTYLPEMGFSVEEQNPNIVGDFCYNFINDQGDLVDCEWNDRVITLGIPSMKSIPMVIAVAGGDEKVSCIRAAINANLINTLVTDEKTAKQLLQSTTSLDEEV